MSARLLNRYIDFLEYIDKGNIYIYISLCIYIYIHIYIYMFISIFIDT